MLATRFDFSPFFLPTEQELRHWFDSGTKVQDLPEADVYDTAEGVLTVCMDMPGVQAKDIDIKVENGVLTVKARRTVEGLKKPYIKERSSKSYHRAFTLPEAIQGDSASAALKDGVLKISLTRKEEAKPKSIKVEVEG